jgi:hypothetical protein
MPLLGCAKHKLAARLGSAATAGEGTQNYLYAAQAAAVAVLAITAAWPGGWWIDPVIGPGHRRGSSAGRHPILARRRLLLTAARPLGPGCHGRHRRA